MFARIKKRRYERDVRVQLIAMFGEIGEKHAEKRSEAVGFLPFLRVTSFRVENHENPPTQFCPGVVNHLLCDASARGINHPVLCDTM